jgi:hypothetical protein
MILRNTVKILLGFFLVLSPSPGASQTYQALWDYVAKWSQVAIAEMYYSKIPASITMAQALHESQYGTSELAVKANNHFGIKCQSEWKGKTYTYQDDDNNTCFRLYDSAAESYRDHSNFLMSRPRYASLFDLDPADYTAWAHGLKKAGYATNPTYASILIKLIVDYKLFLLDTMQPALEPMSSVTDNRIPNAAKQPVVPGPKVFQRNRIKFLIARPGDNIQKLTAELKLYKWQIRAYNEIPRNKDITPGQVVYLQPKRNQAEPGYTFHTVEKGETMYTIAQLYGIKVKWLYKRNHMKPGARLKKGDEIWLRGMKR